MDINLGLSAVATGTVDVITATYSPAPTLVDKKILFLRAIGSNITTTPTFNPNGVGAKTITRKGGEPLAVGDITGAGFVGILMYESANNRWVLLNPGADASGIVSNGQFIQSANGQVKLDFGNGNYIGITTDGNGYSTAYLYMDSASDYGTFGDSNFGYWIGNGATPPLSNFIWGNTAYAEINHGTVINLNSPNINLPQETASRIMATDGSKNIDTLDTATYPSLTELSYVKGVTSAIQTQLGNKQPLDADLTTIAGLTPTNDDIMQYKAGAWANRTLAQLSTDLNIVNGTYTPTPTNVTNVAASTVYLTTYTRIGNHVIVSGKIDIDPTASGAATVLRLSLPIASNFTTAEDAGGAVFAVGVNQGYSISASPANDELNFQGFPSSPFYTQAKRNR